MLAAFSLRLLVPAALSLQLPMFKPVTKAYLQAQQKSHVASLWFCLIGRGAHPSHWGQREGLINQGEITTNPETRTQWSQRHQNTSIRAKEDVVLGKKTEKKKKGSSISEEEINVGRHVRLVQMKTQICSFILGQLPFPGFPFTTCVLVIWLASFFHC